MYRKKKNQRILLFKMKRPKDKGSEYGALNTDPYSGIHYWLQKKQFDEKTRYHKSRMTVRPTRFEKSRMTVRPKRFLMSNFFIKLLLLGPLLIPFMQYLVTGIHYWLQKKQFDEKTRYHKSRMTVRPTRFENLV
jgi:hypothetical protein